MDKLPLELIENIFSHIYWMLPELAAVCHLFNDIIKYNYKSFMMKNAKISNFFSLLAAGNEDCSRYEKRLVTAEIKENLLRVIVKLMRAEVNKYEDIFFNIYRIIAGKDEISNTVTSKILLISYDENFNNAFNPADVMLYFRQEESISDYLKKWSEQQSLILLYMEEQNFNEVRKILDKNDSVTIDQLSCLIKQLDKDSFGEEYIWKWLEVLKRPILRLYKEICGNRINVVFKNSYEANYARKNKIPSYDVKTRCKGYLSWKIINLIDKLYLGHKN